MAEQLVMLETAFVRRDHEVSRSKQLEGTLVRRPGVRYGLFHRFYCSLSLLHVRLVANPTWEVRERSSLLQQPAWLRLLYVVWPL